MIALAFADLAAKDPVDEHHIGEHSTPNPHSTENGVAQSKAPPANAPFSTLMP
jgi:hypothetical protein